jgi:hypothetical protein
MEGTVEDYKLAWVDEANKDILHSKMFTTLEEAVSESMKHKDYFIFKLKSMEDGQYSWDLLPYGISGYYKLGLHLKENAGRYIFFGAIALVGVYGIKYLLKNESHAGHSASQTQI